MIKFTKQYLENIVFIIVTFALSPFFYVVSFLNKLKSQKDLRILVIQTAKIGDVVCSTPVFREIKKHYPCSFLGVLVIPLVKDILINNPYIDEIILLDRKKYSGIKGIFKLIKEIKQRKFNQNFSLLPGILNNLIPFWAGISNRIGTASKYATRGAKIISFFNTHNLECKKHTLALKHYLKLLKFIGIKNTSQKKEIFIELINEKKTDQFFKKHNFKKEELLIGISITAGRNFKEWAPNKFSQLSDKIIEKLNARIIFIGNQNDEKIIKEVQSSMHYKSLKVTEFNLIELASLLKKLSLFIGVDTGPLYIADTFRIPIVNIAGPCEMKSQSPDGNFVIVQKLPSCGPCSFVVSAPNSCKKGHSKCIRNIEVYDVYIAVKKILKYVK